MEATDAESHHMLQVFAANNARRYGRGLVVAAVHGNFAELVFVTLESWKERPLPMLAGNRRINTWLADYDPAREFLLLEAICEGDYVQVYPLRLPFDTVTPQPKSTAIAA